MDFDEIMGYLGLPRAQGAQTRLTDHDRTLAQSLGSQENAYAEDAQARQAMRPQLDPQSLNALNDEMLQRRQQLGDTAMDFGRMSPRLLDYLTRGGQR